MVIKEWKGGLCHVTPKKLLDIKGVKNIIANPGSTSVTRNITAM